jgi:hypothetical protein
LIDRSNPAAFPAVIEDAGRDFKLFLNVKGAPMLIQLPATRRNVFRL